MHEVSEGTGRGMIADGSRAVPAGRGQTCRAGVATAGQPGAASSLPSCERVRFVRVGWGRRAAAVPPLGLTDNICSSVIPPARACTTARGFSAHLNFIAVPEETACSPPPGRPPRGVEPVAACIRCWVERWRGERSSVEVVPDYRVQSALGRMGL